VKTVGMSLCGMQPSVIDQSLIFPTFIAACLTSDHSQREYLKTRLQIQGAYTGNVSRMYMALDTVWRTRESAAGVVDVQKVIKDMGLLIPCSMYQ